MTTNIAPILSEQVEIARSRISDRLRFALMETSGAFGDLGTFIPLLFGMVSLCGLQLGPALVGAGVANLTTGMIFKIPLAVQPMKAIAAVAISESLTESQIVAAGIITGAIFLFLAWSGAIQHLDRYIPKSVVRGLQLALGLKLIAGGVHMMGASWAVFDLVLIGMAAGCVILGWWIKNFPSALVAFCCGLIVLCFTHQDLLCTMQLGMDWHLPDLVHWYAWKTAFTAAALPQIPLTLLNSVFAVCMLSADLFPHRPAAARRVGLSVGLMNVLLCPFGAMPMCHGAGGLAAQYRFGARSGLCNVILGSALICLGLVLGNSLLGALQHYPRSILSVLVIISGGELVLVCRDRLSRRAWIIPGFTAAVCLILPLWAGFLLAWGIAFAAKRKINGKGL
ncbi:MAG: putative sulfate/molybdate transporter [Thermoguttaceae bacterium]|jgi:MFS superfamily sulfate permease-like transporter